MQAEDAINQTLAIRAELEDSPSGKYTGVLGVMKSWDAYGAVGVSCEEGCECQPLDVRAFPSSCTLSFHTCTPNSFIRKDHESRGFACLVFSS